MGDYTIPLGVAKIVKEGTHVTIVGWGGQMNVLKKVFSTRLVNYFKKKSSCELVTKLFRRLRS